MNANEKRNLFLGIVAVAILALITFFVMIGNAGATGGWQLTNTEYGECTGDCDSNEGTRTVTKTYEKQGFICPEGYHDFGVLCEKDGPQFDLKSKVTVVTDTKTEEETEDCYIEVPPVCEEPEKPVVFTGVSDGKAPEPKAPAPVTCTLVLEKPTVWYEGGQFKWATDQKDIEKFSIVYGQTPDSLVYGIDNIPADSRGIEINRPAWNQTWFQVWSWVKGCPSVSETIDP